MSDGGFSNGFATIRTEQFVSQSNTTERSLPADYLTYMRLLQENKTLENSYLMSVGIACHDVKFRKKLSELTKLEEAYKQTLQEKHDTVKQQKCLEQTVDRLLGDVRQLEQIQDELEHKVTRLELRCRGHEQHISDLKKTIDLQQTEISKHRQVAKLIHNLSDETSKKK